MNSSSLEILYEDNHLLVVNKPAGLLTQPSGTDQDSLEKFAKIWIKEKYQKPGNVFLQAAHRLDKPVSGVVVFGRTSKAISRLNHAIREKLSQKIYLALVEGTPRFPESTLEHYLIHDDYHARLATPGETEGKFCRLHYKVIESRKNISLLEVILETGRYHQIRFQLSTIGHPIVGDHKYGSPTNPLLGSICLHHHRMQIPHPTLNAPLYFEAPIPDYWPIC